MLKKRIESLNVEEVEKIKLRIEYFKSWVTTFSIIVSLLAVLSTVIINMILQGERARTDFEIKAVEEIVMTASSPTAAANKAAVLQELFPDRLPSHFLETFERLYGDLTSP